MKQLSLNTNKEIADYCHLFRATSFINKEMYQAAKKELNQITNQFEFFSQTRILLAGTSLELREFEKAKLYYEKALKYPEISKQTYNLAKIYEGLGTTYLFLKKYSKAEEYLIKNLKIKEKESNNKDIFNAYNCLANLYYLQDNNQQAIPYFKKAYGLSKKINDFNTRYISTYNMAAVEENRGNYKQALVYRKEAEKWNDSLNNQNKIWAVADFEKKFAVAQKQKQIKVLKVENELKATQRNVLLYSSIILLILILIGTYLYAQKIKNEKIILLQKNKLNELNTTKDQLFSIVSHDLRSSVNALKTSNSKLMESLENKKRKNYSFTKK